MLFHRSVSKASQITYKAAPRETFIWLLEPQHTLDVQHEWISLIKLIAFCWCAVFYHLKVLKQLTVNESYKTYSVSILSKLFTAKS